MSFETLMKHTIQGRTNGDACSETAEDLSYHMEILSKEDPILASAVKLINENIDIMLARLEVHATELKIEFE
jgi:uncharacterized protein (DUF4213/DUF364 family)